MTPSRSVVGPRPSRLRASVLARGLAAALALCAGPAAVHAGGLVLPGFGPVSTGRAGAAVASVDDPSALATNPAGLAGISGVMVHLGISLIDYRLTVDRDGTYDDVPDRDDPWEGLPHGPVSDTSKPEIGLGSFQIVPMVAVSWDLGGKVKGLTGAIGLYAPNAYPTRKMGAGYVLEDPTVAPPPTRYDIVEQKAAVVLPSLAVGYRINEKFDVGARVSSGFANLEATTYVWGLPNYTEWTGQDSQFHVEASDSFVPAFGLGAKFRPSPSFELGVAWSSSISVDARGEGDAVSGSGNELGGVPAVVVPIPDDRAACAKGGTDDALKACVDFSLPMQATVGGRWILRDDADRQVADVELNAAWEQWSAASDYNIRIDGMAQAGAAEIDLQQTVIRHGFKDSFSVRLGGSWQHDVGPGRLTLRAGAAYDTRTAKTNWERADIDGAARTTVALGASYGLRKVRFDLGGGAVIEPSRTQGPTCNPTMEDDPSCPGPSAVTGPDPVQPLRDPTSPIQSPFSAGAYESGYTLIMLGASTWF